MSRLSRAARRVMVMGAVVVLGAVLIAPSAGSSENGSSSLDPPGVDVPGWEAEKVSGEATGCHSEIEINVDPAFLDGGGGGDGAGAADLTAAAFDVPTGDVGYLGQLLDEVQARVNEISATDDDGPGIEIFHQEAGPTPEVELPWQGGGPVEDEEDDCTLDLFGVLPIPLASDLRVESEGLIGPAGYAHTEAESHDNFGLTYTADQVDTECLATLQDIDAKTNIEDGVYFDLDDGNTKDIPEDPDENEELTDVELTDVNPADPADFFTFEYNLTANEQEESDTAVDVIGLHSELLLSLTLDNVEVFRLTVEGIRDQSHCDIHPVAVVSPIEVDPKFTG